VVAMSNCDGATGLRSFFTSAVGPPAGGGGEVLCGVVIEDDGHQSMKVLDGDRLSMKRSSEGLCMGDDEHALDLAGVFSLYISRYLLALLPRDALCIGLGHGK
jgi:hypothetical protein